MKILADIANPQQLDIINALMHLGNNVYITNNKVSLYESLEKHLPNYLFLDSKTIINKVSLLEKYKIPTISYGLVNDEIIAQANVKCILSDQADSSIPIIPIKGYANLLTYPKSAGDYLLECDILFVLETEKLKPIVDHVLFTTKHSVKCFSTKHMKSLAGVGAGNVNELMSICHSAKVVISENPHFIPVLIIQDIPAFNIQGIDWGKVENIIHNKKARKTYLTTNKSNIYTIFDLIINLGEALQIEELTEKAKQAKTKFI